MTVFVASDYHLNHGNIIKYTERPFQSVEYMNVELINRWNSVVQPNDTVIYLGDFCFKKKERGWDYWRYQLNGNIIFLQGNHDSHTDAPIQSLVFKYGGIDWWCSHYPERKYKYNLHGHSHGKEYKVKRIGGDVLVDCSCENWDYTPVSMDTVMKLIQEA